MNRILVAVMLVLPVGWVWAQDPAGGDGAAGADQGSGEVPGGDSGPQPCALRCVETAYWCTTCGGYVEDARRQVDRREMRHRECGSEVQEHQVCVIRGFRCETCYRMYERQGACCGARTGALADRSRVIYRCGFDGCSVQSYEEGTCTNEECPQYRRRLRRSCEKSGRAPHGGPRGS